MSIGLHNQHSLLNGFVGNYSPDYARRNDEIIAWSVLQQAELALKQADLELKKQKIALDAAAKADQIEVEKARIESQKEIAGMQVGAKAAKDRAELVSKMELEGIRTGVQIAQAAKNRNNPKESK